MYSYTVTFILTNVNFILLMLLKDLTMLTIFHLRIQVHITEPGGKLMFSVHMCTLRLSDYSGTVRSAPEPIHEKKEST